MLVTLLKHEWKSFWRSRNVGAQLTMQILVGLFVLYILLMAVAGAFFLAEALEKYFPNENVVTVFCGFILYYFVVDIIMRFQLQELPTLIVQPYLIQNISRKQLVSFLSWRSLFSIFNLLPFILVVPFLLLHVLPLYGIWVVLALTVTIMSVTIFNHFVVMFAKRKTTLSSLWLLGIVLVLLGIAAADYFGLFSIRTISILIFTPVLKYPWLCLVAILLAFTAYYNDRRFLLSNLYLDEISSSSGPKASADYSWLNRFGFEGELVGLDLRLIFRSKRLRTGLASSGLFLFYGFFYFNKNAISGEKLGVLLFGSIVITGTALAQYSQLIFSSQGSFFDGLMANKLPIRTYIKGKLTLLTSISTIVLFPALLYGMKSWKIVPIMIAGYLFNIGVSAVIYLYAATLNHQRVDLEKTAMFNQKGFNANQLIYPAIVGLVGLVAYLPFAFFINAWAGIVTVGLVGLVSFLLRDNWVNIITRQFQSQKYKLLEGFREK